MIVTKLQGGHSNQLFQYAVARCLALRRGGDLFLDTRWFGAIAEGDTRRVFELGGYRFAPRVIAPDSFALVDWPASPRSRQGGIAVRKRRKPTLVRYREAGNGFDPHVLDQSDQTYLEGWWQDERYFKEIRSTLLDEFDLREPVGGRNAAWLRQIRDCVSVSVHVRRGDYVGNPAAAAFHGVLDVSYYGAALERLTEAVGERGRQFFVFSDDIDWCRRHLALGQATTFVDSGNSGAEDMLLMKHCKHHIVANSSFSWWGAWLSDHPAKVVIAPRNWFADARANAETEIVPPGWLRI